MVEKISYRTSFAKAFHRTILVAYVFYVLYGDNFVVPPEGSTNDLNRKGYGGKFKYLTCLNLFVLQLGYFALATLNDLVGSNERSQSKRTILQRVRDFLFTTLIFPMALFVCSIFWGLYYVDRNLIFPEHYEAWYPRWANHFEHSLPTGAVLLEMLLLYHKFPKSNVVKILPMLLSFVAYFSWILYLKFEKNILVYPFFSEFSNEGLVLFLAACGIPGFIFLFLGGFLHRAIWGADSEPKKKEQPKKKNNQKKGNNKKSKNPELENTKKKQKIIEEPQSNKKKGKNSDSNSINNQNLKNKKSNKKNR